MQDKQQWIGALISFGILMVVLGLRARKMNKPQPIKVERLWMLPAFYTLIVVALYWVHPPHGLRWFYAAAALVAGLGLGWYRGKLMYLTVDAETEEVRQRGSMAAMIFVVLLVGLRYLGRTMMMESGQGDPETVVAITDTLLAFGLGFLAGQRAEVGLRARAMIDAQRRGGQ